MSDTKRNSPPQIATAEKLGTESLVLLSKEAPEVFEMIMKERRHQDRLDWAEVITQALGHLSGLAALIILAAISWHVFDLKFATQGAAIICTGAVSIVTVFVTGRVTAGRARTKPDRKPGAAAENPAA